MDKKKKVLFLDDRSKRFRAAVEKYPADEYDLTLVCTVVECCERLANDGPWDIISLDHDLNYESFVDSNRKDCGMEVVRFIDRNFIFLNQHGWHKKATFIIHSKNKIAAVTMMDAILEMIIMHYGEGTKASDAPTICRELLYE